jgi:hypothetical protein
VEGTAAFLGVAVSTLKRWRRRTRKTGRQTGPPFSYAGSSGSPSMPRS